MAKSSGLGDQLYISGVDIGADINAIGSLSTPRETLPSTGITQSANARMFGKRDASAEFTSYFEVTPGGTFDTLKALPMSDVQVMYLRGELLGGEGLGLVGKQVNYDPSRGDDGSFLFGTSVSSNGFGADWGVQLTPGKRSDAVATDGTSVDLVTGPVLFGWQAYVQVFSVVGTCTVKIQDSPDDAVFTDLAGGAFATVAGPSVERIQSVSPTGSVDRYVRVVTSGAFTECSFAVVFTRNEGLRAL